MASCNQSRNYIDELLEIVNEIIIRKKEPEGCNIRCPPFGCPRGPCPGACSYQGVPDPCCVSQMPCCSPPPSLPCRAPPACCLKSYAKEVGCPPESCFSPPGARFRLLLNYPLRNNIKVECTSQSPPCGPNSTNCVTTCCPLPTFPCI